MAVIVAESKTVHLHRGQAGLSAASPYRAITAAAPLDPSGDDQRVGLVLLLGAMPIGFGCVAQSETDGAGCLKRGKWVDAVGAGAVWPGWAVSVQTPGGCGRMRCHGDTGARDGVRRRWAAAVLVGAAIVAGLVWAVTGSHPETGWLGDKALERAGWVGAIIATLAFAVATVRWAWLWNADRPSRELAGPDGFLGDAPRPGLRNPGTAVGAENDHGAGGCGRVGVGRAV
ncbi:hypothetical protein [Actinomadura citrea]|uniref:Uncharacterized protein n=1 Tax=Actinomadura citrea TaxID=46158 RepID=A0A7Y9KGD7_9ACTN|nr:hypothetical protein [Actinomadura citrea]NYE14903.1 hypothetical protein [Actinomadura citrea]